MADAEAEGFTLDQINKGMRDRLQGRVESERAREKGGLATWSLTDAERERASAAARI